MSTAVTTCRSCGLENEPGRDFCDRCGEYLSWAPTSYVPAVADVDAYAHGHDDDNGDAAPAGAAATTTHEPAPASAA
ncbi:MAG TPA: hypothetical protein VL120_18635, partial [Solirubrobacteraceae bacterium]|nr:hypothetical protein [Solirubrobacteraceae bacterium]